MGHVFRARDLRLKRDVAVKVIVPSNSHDRASVIRFQNEARACSALNHPHIVNVFDAGEENGVAYLVMELVVGTTLDAWLAQRHPRLEQIIDVFVQVADAVAAVHEAGILHRDLKPTNILVTEQGYAKVVDFGLAKVYASAASVDDTALRTADGAILGTPAYMSPEQAGGRAADARSDIFALGAVLYEAVSGT
ncbi:MAG TPA: serine/threonine-protein kinase, partial [Thermoanaerobaculia bacterium]